MNDTETTGILDAPVETPELDPAQIAPEACAADTAGLGDVIGMADFIAQFGDGLLASVKSLNPPVDDGQPNPSRDAVMDALTRRPFEAQRQVVHAAAKLLVDRDQPACIVNAEMGTGKTMMAIATAAVLEAEGFQRTLVISPPHLVYKWRREIKETVPRARVWILNGPDTLRKLLQIREMRERPQVPEFFILGRVRMRMGFHWRPVCATRRVVDGTRVGTLAACPGCGTLLRRPVADEGDLPLDRAQALVFLSSERSSCVECGSPLWTLVHRVQSTRTRRELVAEALQQMPTIGPKKAEQLLGAFGEDLLATMLEDNLYEFVNLMDANGDLVFTDRQAVRMERALATFEFSIGQGGYQATEFIKRYLPQGYFGLMVVDEGHEYKNEGSAQGQAMGVLARKCRKTLLLTGTLMGGYADDVFHLLWRLNPAAMIEDGFKPDARRSMTAPAMNFMLARGLVESSGAKHYTIFYITPMGNTAWTYWLVHLSNSFKARDVMMELHWQHANHFSHYLEPDLFTLGYRTNDDAAATGQEGFDLGQAHHFDALASMQCRSGLSEKLIPAVYDGSPQPFAQWLDTIGSSTPATADMIRQALDPGIRSGDIIARSADGALRTKGTSVKATDVLSASPQRPLILLPRA